MKKIVNVLTLLALSACSRQPSYESNTSSLSVYINSPIPDSARVLAMSARVDSSIVLIQAKLEMDFNDFKVLMRSLDMHQSSDAYMTPVYYFDDKLPGTWWTPPDPIDQSLLPERYCGSKSYQERGNSIIAIWSNGIAYLYKFGERK